MPTTPARFPNGVTNTTPASVLRTLPIPQRKDLVEYWNDFHVYTAAEWTVTETQAGATQAIIDGHGGLLALTNSAADDDLNSIQSSKENFKFATNRQAWFTCRWKVSDATQSDVVVGLCITDTTPLDVTDGVYFLKADGAATLAYGVEKNNTASTGTVGTVVGDTFHVTDFYWNGVDAIEFYFDGAKVATVASTNLVDDEELAITLSVQNGDGNARTLTIDYVGVWMERA